MSTRARAIFGIVTMLLGVTVACSFGGNVSGVQPNTGETSDGSGQAAAGPSATAVPNNAGEDSAPTFAEGGWTGGEAEVRVTGSDTRTISGSLMTESSSTEGGTTGLTYVGGATGLDTIGISISTEYQPFDMSVSQEDGFYVEIRFGQPPCEVTYQETSDKRIEGIFRCEHAEITLGPNKGPAIMEGSFTATR